jgi:hypothetical protein
MGSGITPCAQECKWIVYFGKIPKGSSCFPGQDVWHMVSSPLIMCPGRIVSQARGLFPVLRQCP